MTEFVAPGAVMCPEMLRRMAIQLGLPDGDVDELWERHVELCDADRSDYGGLRWRGLVTSQVKRNADAPRVRRPDDAEERAMRRRELEAKRAEELEYQKHAVSLNTWLQGMREGRWYPRTDAERALLAAPAPHPTANPGEWLMAHLPKVATPARQHPCAGCELGSAQSWTNADGRRFYGAQCANCQRIDDGARREGR